MAKTNQKDSVPPSNEEVIQAETLYKIYGGLHRAYGTYVTGSSKSSKGKVSGQATTILEPYKASLWLTHLAGVKGLGVIPIMDTHECVWGCIDIDTYDLDFAAVEKEIIRLNLPLVMIRSKSGGLHLTMFFTEPINCKLVQLKLSEISVALGFPGVEIFPKQSHLANKRDIGNWLNMPYYGAYVGAVDRVALLNGVPLTLDQFIVFVTKVRISKQQFDALEVAMPDNFSDGPPCLQFMAGKGIPEGNRNNALFAIGVYSRMKYTEDWESELDRYNHLFLNPPLPAKEVVVLTKSLQKTDYFYPCNKAPLEQYCNKSVCRSRKFGIGSLDAEFNINLGSLMKIVTDPPTWILDIEGVRVALDTEDLLSQERFRRFCVASINKLPPTLPKAEWEKIVREKLASVEYIDAPKESRTSDRIQQYLKGYLTLTPPAKEKREMLMGRPYLDEDTRCYFFRGNDFIKFLEVQGVRNAEPRKIWVSLRSLEADHKQINVRGSNFQVWTIPAINIMDVEEGDIEYKVPTTDDLSETF
jgi:hypothetical protein